MPKISAEGLVGLVLTLVIVVLDQAGVKNPFVLWIAFGLALLLCVDWLRRSDKPNKNKLISITVIGFVAFACYLLYQTKGVHEYKAEQKPDAASGSKAQQNASTSPGPSPKASTSPAPKLKTTKTTKDGGSPLSAPTPSSQPITPPTTETDVHSLLISGALSQGWTLSKRAKSWDLYLILNSDNLSRPVLDAMDKMVISLEPDIVPQVVSLWEDIRRFVPNPRPIRTEYGELKDQEFVEHLVHYRFNSPQTLMWNYEVMVHGNGVPAQSDPVNPIELSGLSPKSRQTIQKLDELALHSVNRRYIDATIKISK